MEGAASLVTRVVLFSLLASFCQCEKKYIYFSDFNSCDKAVTVGPQDQVFVKGERTPTGGSSSFSTCVLQFKASSFENKLCVKFNSLKFQNNELQLEFYNSLDPTAIQPDKVYNKTTLASERIPNEVCSTGRDIALQLKPLKSGANIKDVEIDIEVFNMQGDQRVVLMSRDGGVTYKLDDSTISVLNRDAASSTALTPSSQVYFTYVGTNPNKTVCLFFGRNKNDCGYELKVFEGDATSFTEIHTYSCKNDQPQQWCSSQKTMHLQFTETKSQPSSLFSVTVKDGMKGEGIFTTPSSTGSESRFCSMTLGFTVAMAIAWL